MPEGWEWDETLYQGSAPFYVQGRPPYAPELADRLAAHLALDGTGRLLDAGCGPGVLTVVLVPFVAEAVGLDPDPDMLKEGARRARAAGLGHIRWVRARGEDLPAGLGTFQVATFGQSFHWMDQSRVAATIFDMLAANGAFVHVADAKGPRRRQGHLPHPEPPYAAIDGLIRDWLGPVPRAAQGFLRYGTPDGEERVLAAAGFAGPERLLLPGGGAWVRREDDIVAWVWSRATSAPHLFGERRGAFETDLRALLRGASPTGLFAEWLPDTDVRIWRRPGECSRPAAGN